MHVKKNTPSHPEPSFEGDAPCQLGHLPLRRPRGRLGASPGPDVAPRLRRWRIQGMRQQVGVVEEVLTAGAHWTDTKESCWESHRGEEASKEGHLGKGQTILVVGR